MIGCLLCLPGRDILRFGLAIMAFLPGTFGELFGDVNVPLNQEKRILQIIQLKKSEN